MPDDNRIARTIAALEGLGLTRAEAPPEPVTITRLDRHTAMAETVLAIMGTRLSVTALGEAATRLEEAIGGALEELQRLVAVLSRHDRASAVAQLNAAGRLDDAPPELHAVLARALWFHALSDGAFDPTVAPLVDLFRSRAGAALPPAEGEIAEARQRVGAGHVVCTDRGVRFDRSGVAITLDGIAKGYIVDAMTDVLARHGVARYLVNAGGDIRAAGLNAHREPWTIAVEDPAGGGVHPDVIHLMGRAVATSGGYARSYDPERGFHHIVNGRTGYSPRQHASVSVLAPSAAAADALATAVFVLEADAGLALIEQLHDCACLIVAADGRLLRSRHWPSAPLPAGGTHS